MGARLTVTAVGFSLLELCQQGAEFDKFRILFDIAFQFAGKRFFESVFQLEGCRLRSAQFDEHACMIQEDGGWSVVKCGSRSIALLGFLPLFEGNMEVAKIVPVLGIVGVKFGNSLGGSKCIFGGVILLFDSGEKRKEFKVVLIFFKEF